MDNKIYKYNCECCKLNTNCTSVWLRHLESAKHKRQGDPKFHKCELCKFQTKTSWNFKLHKLSQHSTKEERSKSKYNCEICDVVFFSPLYYNSHMKGSKHKNLVLLDEYNKTINIKLT
jgi:hypothetical protein